MRKLTLYSKKKITLMSFLFLVGLLASSFAPYVQGITRTTYSTIAQSGDDREPLVIEVNAAADHLWGEMRWPWYATESEIKSGEKEPYLEWESQKVGDVTYSEGWMKHWAKIDSEQYDIEGVRDEVDLRITFDLEDQTATGSLTGFYASTYKTACGGPYGCLDFLGKGIDVAWCVGSFDESFSFPIEPGTWAGEDWVFDVNTSMTLNFNGRAQTGKWPSDQGDNRTVERSETVYETVRIVGKIDIKYDYQVSISFSISDYYSDDPEGPSFQLSDQWGSPCSVAEITEWSDSTIDEEQVSVTGPDSIWLLSELDEKFELDGWEEIEDLRWVDWIFEYEDEYGEWKELDKVTREGDVSQLEASELNLDEWFELAASIGYIEKDSKILNAQVQAQLISDNQEILATSNVHEFKIEYSAELKLEAERDVLNVYPTGENRTELRVAYGKLNLEEPIRFDAPNAPAYLDIRFDPEYVETDLSGIGETHIILDCDFSQVPRAQMEGDEPITVEIRARSGSLEKSTEIEVVLKPVEWLLMFYVATDTRDSLQEGDVSNLDDISSLFELHSLSEDPIKVGVTVLIDLHEDWQISSERLKGGSAYLLKLGNSGFEKVLSLGRVNMGDSELLNLFLETSYSMMPTIKGQLTICDHGDGMLGVAYDLSNQGVLSIEDIKNAFEDLDVNILAFDACYMAQIEVLYELREITNYFVASQIAIPGVGLTYKSFVGALLDNPEMMPKEYGELIVETFSMPKERSHQLALISSGEIDSLFDKLKALSEILVLDYKGEANSFDSVSKFLRSETPPKHPYYDICEFANTLTDVNDILIYSEATDVNDVLPDVVVKNKAAIYYSSGRLVSDAGFNGLSFFLWPNGDDSISGRTFNTYMRYYENTNLCKNTKWKEFIDLHREKVQADTTIYLCLDQEGHELYPHAYDAQGRHVGRNPDHWSKTKLDLEIPWATYFDFRNGTKIISLPGNLTDFTLKVDGMSMEEEEESYQLTCSLIRGEEIFSREVIDNPIEENTNHTAQIKVENNDFEIGEIKIEKEIIEPVQEPEPQPEPGGIPGFTVESTILAIALATILIKWMTRGKNSLNI